MTARPVKRQPRGEDRQERIIAVAVRHFATYGYTRTSIARIAADAGVSDAGVLHHFGTKSGLFTAVIERRESAYTAQHLLEATSVRDLFDRIIAGAAAAAADPAFLRFRAVLSGEALLDGNPASGHLRDVLATSLEALTPIVTAGIDSGEVLPDTEPRQLVLELLALNEGIRDQAVTMPEDIPYIEVFTRALDRLYRAIAVAPAQPPAATPQPAQA